MAPPLHAWTGPLSVLLGLWIGVGALPRAADGNSCVPPPRPDGLLEATVRRVIDGDTIVVGLANGRLERVRLVGIDSPELHESNKLTREVARTGQDAATFQGMGRVAAAFAAFWLQAGRRVALELDVERRDREGRLLAYVWREDGVLVNLALLEAGQARLFTVPPNVRHADRLRACAAAARAARRGLWASADTRGR